MEQKELEYLRQVEDHASRTGWVSPLTREDKEYFAYLRQVSKRYNIDMSKANRLEYNFCDSCCRERVLRTSHILRNPEAQASLLAPFIELSLNKRPNEANIKVRYGCKVKHQTAIIYWRYLQ